MAEEAPQTLRVHCNSCGHETKHVLVASRVQERKDLMKGKYEIEWSYTSEMLECCGCETVCLRRKFWWSEEPGDETIEYFPPQASRRKPKWASELGTELEGLLDEVYIAMHAGSRRLSMMGARAIIDIVMQEKVGDIGGFERKLAALVEHGYISVRNQEVLRAALSAGNAAAHRGHRASVEEVAQVMDIVENLLHTDVLEKAANSLNQTVPKRRKLPPSTGRSK